MKREHYVSGREDRMSNSKEVRRLMHFEATRRPSLPRCKGKGRERQEATLERQSGQFTGSLVRRVRELGFTDAASGCQKNFFLFLK